MTRSRKSAKDTPPGGGVHLEINAHPNKIYSAFFEKGVD